MVAEYQGALCIFIVHDVIITGVRQPPSNWGPSFLNPDVMSKAKPLPSNKIDYCFRFHTFRGEKWSANMTDCLLFIIPIYWKSSFNFEDLKFHNYMCEYDRRMSLCRANNFLMKVFSSTYCLICQWLWTYKDVKS